VRCLYPAKGVIQLLAQGKFPAEAHYFRNMAAVIIGPLIKSIASCILGLSVVCGGCAEASASDIAHETGNVPAECANTVAIGGKGICLPIVLGMKECSGDPEIMALPGVTVTDKSTTIGLYVREEQLTDLAGTMETGFDDYLKVYYMNALGDKDFPPKAAEWMAGEFAKGYTKRTWPTLRTDLAKVFDGVEFGQPVVMESYAPSPSISTVVTLGPVRTDDGFERYNLMSLSFCAVKDRLIWVAHYLEYEGAESVSKARAKSDSR